MIGDLVLELARTLTLTAPPPPPLPYLGMDQPTDTGSHLLDGLAARGIFRKYEQVLDVGAGLGASARWLAARLGCEVVATAGADEAAIALALTRRTALAAQVRHVAADPEALPVAAARFTHAWIVEALPRVRDAVATLAEAHRALRPGGTLAVQDLVLADTARPVVVPGWRFARLAVRVAQVAAAGFVDLDVRDVSAEADERAARVVAARALFTERASADAALGALVAERRALAAARAAGRLSAVQILARRP
jgi:SAM-dependent methyltransferase